MCSSDEASCNVARLSEVEYFSDNGANECKYRLKKYGGPDVEQIGCL